MAITSAPIRGIVTGRTIVLDVPTEFPDGQAVSVRLSRAAGDGPDALRRAFGSWADDPDGLDGFLGDVRRDRSDRRAGAE